MSHEWRHHFRLGGLGFFSLVVIRQIGEFTLVLRNHILLLAVAMTVASVPVVAVTQVLSREQIRQLSWPDLVPKIEIPAGRLKQLTIAQRRQLSRLVNARRLASKNPHQTGIGSGSGSDFANNAMSGFGPANRMAPEQGDRAIIRELTAAGFNIDELIHDYKTRERRLVALGEMLVEKLNGKRVAITGYLLPLEFSGPGTPQGVREFFLVPYVGACIHVPPPPPNQMIFVTSTKPVISSGLFTPVSVTGRLTAKGARKKLSLVDGAANVDAGYSLQAEDIHILEK